MKIIIENTFEKQLTLQKQAFQILFPISNTESFETLKLKVDYIKYKCRKNNINKFFWSFIGNEITNKPFFIELLKYLEDGISEYQSIQITSDIQHTKKYWAKVCQATELLQFKSITFNINEEIKNDFFDTCLFLLSENVQVQINQSLSFSNQKFSDLGIQVNLNTNLKENV